MKALYRKYRPCKLADVVGQEQVTKVLESSLKQGKVNHAYLFIGPRGTGKTSVARIFAHAVNGFEYQLEDDYVDIVEIDGFLVFHNGYVHASYQFFPFFRCQAFQIDQMFHNISL